MVEHDPMLRTPFYPDLSEYLEVDGGVMGPGSVYVSKDGQRYLKTSPSLAEAPGTMQDHLTAAQLPVPHLYESGILPDGRPYVVIESMGQSFKYLENETATPPLDHQANEFTDVVANWTSLQADYLVPGNREELRSAIYADDLCTNIQNILPTPAAAQLAICSAQILDRLMHLQFTINHGDFVPRNITIRGPFDLQFAHLGPLGYDAITSLYHHRMFPSKVAGKIFEATRTYSFTDAQIARALSTYSTILVDKGLPPLTHSLDELVLAKLIWASRATIPPNLRKWRLRLLLQAAEAYQSGEQGAATQIVIHSDEVLAL